MLQSNLLVENEQVLALTKMHGSRRRMQDRLSKLPGFHGRFTCTTIDSFAWRLIRRWSSLARIKGRVEPEVNDYDGVCKCAGILLSDEVVKQWTTSTFPIIIIDELQDSKGGQLEMIQSLAESATCLVAADDYQDLDASKVNTAVAWAREYGEVVPLTQIHRTSKAGLLEAASALRKGHPVPAKGPGFNMLAAPNKNVGASFVSKNLTWWKSSNDIAVITPVRPERSLFVRELIQRVQAKPISNPAVGPHQIPWEVSQEDECEQFLASISLPIDPLVEVNANEISLYGESSLSKNLRVWFDRQRRLTGRTIFTVAEVLQQARLIHQRSRAYRRVRESGVRAMTIHQAKNREFDSVIVLWPYETTGTPDRQRRLLYNAVTRAKRQAVVIVQDPNRLNKPPFEP